MSAPTPREPATRLALFRRMAIKFVIVCVAMTILVVIGEMLLFHFVARSGWTLSGPSAGMAQMEWHWQFRFGQLPPQADSVIAPVGPPPRPLYYGREYGLPVHWYRIEDAGPPEEVTTDNGLIYYAFHAGPEVPFLHFPNFVRSLHQVPYFLHEVRYRLDDAYRPVIHGGAHISADGRLWCQAASYTPFFMRVREYVGTVDDFMPPSSARGWKTTQFVWSGYTYNVILLLILFGWMFFVHDVWILIGYKRYRARMRERRGLCIECGYDLQGHKDGQCPECGKAMMSGAHHAGAKARS